MPIPQIPAEVDQHYHAEPRFVRLIADHLAGMSDRYALEEYEALYHPYAGATCGPPGRS